MAKGLFSGAQVVKAPATKGRKAEVADVEIKGLSRLAALDAAIKTLMAHREAEEAQVKGQMTDHFLKEGTMNNRRPDNFNGVENKASASCQLKIRSTASVLSADEQVLLEKHGISFGTNVKTPEAFLINPAYTNDMALLAKVEEALEGVDLPDDFLMKQEEVAVKVATDESITEVFSKPIAVAELLMPVVTTLAIKPKIEGDFWGIIDEIMADEA